MLDQSRIARLCSLVILLSLATAAWSDTMTGVSSKASQGSNDSVLWSQLGADGTAISASVNATSGAGVAVHIGFAGPNSLASAVCAASPTCSWSGTGFTAGARIIWTSNAVAGGNGPVTLSFGKSVSGAGALIQADEPGQFVAQIQAFNGSTLLGSFSVTSASGNEVYIGILDQTGPSITSVTFSLTACGSADANCILSDFGLDTVFLNVPSGSAPAVTLTPTSLGFGDIAVGVTSAVKTVTLKKTGSAALTITKIAITGTNSADFLETATTCGASLAASATCTISVDFKPAATGARSAAISITDNASGSPQQAPLSGTGTTAKFTPPSLGFGDMAIGVASPARTITLTNIGTTTMTITAIAITGTNASDFAQTHTCGASLAAAASCTFSVTFKPSATGTRTASLSVADSAAGSPQLVPLSGIGTTLKFSPPSLSFGAVATGVTSAARTITLTNIGTTTLTITAIAITGANASDFAQTHTCGASLAVGANCTFSVTFKPSATGTRSASLSVTDNAVGSPQLVPLSGVGTTAKLAPSSLSFGSVTVGTTSAAKTVTLTNIGTTALTISAIAITGTNAGDFLQTHTCGASLAAGASCTISVKFKPTAKGARSAAVSVTDNAAGSPQKVPLSGTGA